MAGATVVGDWKVNGSVMKSGASGTTDGAGDATITSGGLRQTASSDLIEFCVTDISGTGLVYDPTANLEGCDAATAPPPPPPPPPGALTLSANVRGHNTVRLSWSGSGATSFDVHRTDLDGPGGSVIVATVSGSSYTDDPPAGSWRYQVCESGSLDVCSNTEDATTRR